MSPNDQAETLEVVLNRCADPDICQWQALAYACDQLGVQAGTFFRLSQDGQSLEVASTQGVLPWRIARGAFPLSKGICGWVAREKKPALINEIAKDNRFNREIDLLTQFQTHSVLAAPVLVKGAVYGVIELINRNTHPFSDADQKLLETIASTTASRLSEF